MTCYHIVYTIVQPYILSKQSHHYLDSPSN